MEVLTTVLAAYRDGAPWPDVFAPEIVGAEDADADDVVELEGFTALLAFRVAVEEACDPWGVFAVFVFVVVVLSHGRILS
jgi:hypothetical protein